MSIPVYTSESSIAHLIKKNNSIAYNAKLQEDNTKKKVSLDKINDALGTNLEQKDLCYVKTIMATTGRNGNDDVFDRDEMWKARKSPEDKPFNLEHDEDNIIGHITANSVMDEDFNTIDDDTEAEDLPNKFHLVTNAVIYKKWKKDKNRKRIATVLNDVAEGNYFVSMECMFTDFDYLLFDESTGDEWIVERNEDTAFLTQNLRVYGGSGVYNNRRVGRILKNITFSGKGLVKNPANPESFILETVAEVKKPKSSLILINSTQAEKKMADNSNEYDLVKELKEQLAQLKQDIVAEARKNTELKSQIASLEKENAQLKDQGTKANKEIQDLEVSCANKDETIEKLEAVKKELESAKAEVEDLKAKLKEVEDAKAKFEAEASEREAKARFASRKAVVMQTLNKDEKAAEAFVKGFENLNDDQFKAVVDTIPAQAKKSTIEELMETDDEDKESDALLALASQNDDNDDEYSKENLEKDFYEFSKSSNLFNDN